MAESGKKVQAFELDTHFDTKGGVSGKDFDLDVPSDNQSTDDLIKIAGPVPIQAWFIIITELCERFAYYGVTLMFVPYLTQNLGQTKPNASAINRGFSFLAYLTTVIGAIIADTWLGKFKTILLFSGLYFIGLILISVSALPVSVDAGFGFTGFCLAIYCFIAWGTGGIKANVSVFTAEQIPLGDRPAANPNQIISYDMTVERVFRFFYWSVNVGSLLGPLICPPLVETGGGYALGFGIPAVIFVVAASVFITGKYTCKYNHVPVKGNPIMKAFRVIRYILANQNKKAKDGHWMDVAKGCPTSDWDDKFVEDLKRTLQACKVFSFFIIYWALNNNTSDAFILQGLTMSIPSWLKAEQLNLFNSILIIVAIPVLDLWVMPLLRKCGFKMGPVVRITLGFGICTIAFIYMTILQKLVYNTGPYYDLTNLPEDVANPHNEISIFYQVPGYLLLALGEVFAATTALEFSFQYAAPELKSVVSSFYYLSVCLSSLVGMILAIWSYDPNYVALFSAQTIIMGIATVLFYYIFRGSDEE